HAGEVRVAEDGVEHLVRVAELPEVRDAHERVPLLRVVSDGVALVVEVVQQRGDGPGLLVAAQRAGVGDDGGLHGQHVLAQALALRPLLHEGESRFPGHGHARSYPAHVTACASWGCASRSFTGLARTPNARRPDSSGTNSAR